MREPQDLLREYAQLNSRRKGEGLSPLEYQRWLHLPAQLERVFPGRPPLGRGGEIRIRVAFKTLEEVADAVMWEVRPAGLFVNTPFAPAEGTRFTLILEIEETGEEHTAPVTVVSNHVGPGFSTANLGVGLRFTQSNCSLSSVLAEISRPGVEANGDVGERSPATR